MSTLPSQGYNNLSSLSNQLAFSAPHHKFHNASLTLNASHTGHSHTYLLSVKKERGFPQGKEREQERGSSVRRGETCADEDGHTGAEELGRS